MPYQQNPWPVLQSKATDLEARSKEIRELAEEFNEALKKVLQKRKANKPCNM